MLKQHKLLWLFVLSILLTSCSNKSVGSDENPDSFDFNGVWVGNASGSDFRFVIDLNSTSKAENITYSCTANLDLISNSDKKLVTKVDLLSGECVDNAIAVFGYLTNDKISFELFTPGTDYENGSPFINGTLDRD